MTLKLLLILAVIVIVYFVFFKKKPPKKSDTSDINEMVQCPACGVYTPLQDAIISSNNKYYCSKECVEKA